MRRGEGIARTKRAKIDCQLFQNGNETKNSKTRELKTRKRSYRSMRIQEQDMIWEDRESVNVIRSEVLVDELIRIIDRFDAVMKGMSKILSGATNRNSKLIYFVNPTLLWSAN